jgi:hypothetical protein
MQDERVSTADVPARDQLRLKEENAAALLLAMGRAGGGEESLEPRLTDTVGGSPP